MPRQLKALWYQGRLNTFGLYSKAKASSLLFFSRYFFNKPCRQEHKKGSALSQTDPKAEGEPYKCFNALFRLWHGR